MGWTDEIVGKWTKEGFHVSQETVDYLLWYCERKMDIANIKNRKEYLPLLFEDELKNHLFRQYINTTTVLRMINGGGYEKCVVFV